ncbi:MAG: acetate--CoA ligase family protein [Candidatus Natronoplasma sp.]
MGKIGFTVIMVVYLSLDGSKRGQNIDKLLDPDNVAIFGVSLSEDEKMGNIIYHNLKSSHRDVYAINPKAEGEEGFFTTIHDVPDEVDLAILAIPSKYAVDAVEDCVKFGVGAIILVSGGFGETGEKGKKMEEEIKEILKGNRTRLLGPNTMGVLIPPVDLDTFFLPEDRVERPEEGGIAFISQSGFMATPFVETLCAHHTGLSGFVGIGNRLDIDEVELMEYFAEDEETDVIALYLESLSDGRELYEIAKRTAPEKPIVLLKSGRSDIGRKATQSHTGSLASTSDRMVKGVSKQAGIINAYDERELTDFSEVLGMNDPIEGENIAVISSAGGTGVIASDYIEDSDPGLGLKMPSFSDDIKERLDDVILPIASGDNPIDLTANVTDEMVDDVLKILQDEDKIDAIFLYALFQSPYVGEGMVESISKWYHQGDKPIVVACIGDKTGDRWREEFYKEGVPAYPSTKRAIDCLAVLVDRGRTLSHLGECIDD